MLAVITVTPLQTLIAKKILKDRGETKFILLTINAHSSAVLQHQFDDLSKSALRATFLTLNKSGWENLRRVRAELRSWKAAGVDALLFASIDNVFIQYIINSGSIFHFDTFDDGVCNILTESVYHKKTALRLLTRLKYWVVRRNVDQDWIRLNTRKHYSIFAGMRNIVAPQKIKAVELLGDTDIQAVSDHSNIRYKKVKIFLGFLQHPNYVAAVRRVNPDIYLPHPMESVDPHIGNVVRITMIAEEFIAELANQYEDVEVYACASTVLFTIKARRVTRYVVDLGGRMTALQAEFNHAAEMLGCRFLKFDDL